MFRAAQANPFDDAVVKATDENLTSENWEYILDVCDKVQGSDTGPKDVVASMIKRLAHRNANVQLYTLELGNALSQNCGAKVYTELASRSFTEALLRLANDRNTHQAVKAKILERMGEWSEMFSRDPDLGIMEQQYARLKSANPSLQPPSKPFKREITDLDRQKEEQELQMALALSIKDKLPAGNASQSKKQDTSQPSQAQRPQNTATSKPSVLPSGTTAATVSRVRALFDFQPSEPGELAFRKGDIIAVLESVYKDWWNGSLRGQTGIFPLNYVEKLTDPTDEEVQREAQMEAEVFAEIKNVEKLLALLSTSGVDGNVRDNEEITTLYHSTLAIRPKLIELIGKYSQKKDDFTQLNEKFIKARRDYENLLEASMSQPPPQHQYGRPPPAGAYNYSNAPPPQHQPGYAPPQDPQRFYSPAPEQSFAPQNGPAPFYMIPPSQQSQAPQQPQHAQPPQQPQAPQQAQVPQPDPLRVQKPLSPGPYGHPQAQITHDHRPISTYANPQELATSSYDPPGNNASSFGQPSYPPPAGAGIEHQLPQQQQGGYGHGYQAPPPPGDAPIPGPLQVQGRPPIPGQQQQQQQQPPRFQPYQPPGGVRAGGGGGGEGGGDASDFYR